MATTGGTRKAEGAPLGAADGGADVGAVPEHAPSEVGTGPAGTRAAWIAVACTPVGVVVGVAVAYAVAGLIGVTLDPAGPSTVTAAQRALVWGVAGAVWLAAPVAGVALAVRPARSASRSGVAALVASSVLVVAMAVITVVSIAGG